ncbi:titin homolog isoform X2 [Kryptolebias marmoratus]|uniref:titin homolog isoform X2 n=1 Tax=Kryptolebias marmoratus TaxID=37003 RepID=UPI0018AC9E16|nr:titin homolog isoform X2 [Kryptolebias marmoratus]
MAEEDLSLSDALTDSVPQPGSESVVEKDFVAQLEAETFDDQVKEMVEKKDYIPLLDNDDTRPEFSQSGQIVRDVEVGVVPSQVEKDPDVAELQHPTIQTVSYTPKESNSMLHETQALHVPLDLSEGALGESWSNQTGCLSTDPLFMPSVSMSFAKQPGHIAASPDNPLYSCHSHESAVYVGGDERFVDGSDQKLKKKKKRQQKDEGSYEHLESRGQLDKEENAYPSEEFYQRIDPRRDKGGGGWENQFGRRGGQGKRGKNRKKLPEEWAVMAESFISSSEASSQITEKALMNQGDISQNPCKKEVPSEKGLFSQHLSGDGFPTTTGVSSPLTLGSELNATAAPFTLPLPTKTILGSFPKTPSSGDLADILTEPENVSFGHSKQAFYSPCFLKTKEVGGNIVDHTSLYPECSIDGMSEEDTSAFSSSPKTSRAPTEDVLASGPPLSSSDVSWLLNDSQMSSNNEIFYFSDVGASGQSLSLGLSFNSPSPVPLRSPKTTAQEYQPKPKDAKSVQKQSKKSPILCLPSSDRSSTSPEAKTLASQTSTITASSSAPPVSTLSVSGSGLNPTAKPFFPSFADPMEYLDVMPPVVSIMKVKSDNVEETEKKEEKLEDNVNKLETFDTLDKVEQCSVKVECTEQQTLAKGEKEVEKGKEKEKDYEAGNVKEEQYTDKIKEAEKLAENIDKQTDTEKVKEREMEKVELVHQEEKEEDKKLQVEESLVKVDKAEKEGEVMIDKVENKDVKLEKIERNEDPKVEEKKARNFVENNEKFKLEERKVETSEKGQNVDKIDNNEKKQKTEVEDGDEQHIDKMKIGSEQQPTSVKNDGIYDKMEKKPYVEKQATSEVQDPEKGKASPNQAKKIEKETEVCGPSVRPVNKAAQKIKEEEQNKMQADKKPVEKKKTEVKSNGEGAKTPAKPAARSSITASKHHIAADKKTKLATGVSRPGNIAKSRPSNTTVCSSTTATAKCSTPLLTISTKDKKLTTPKVPSTAAGPGKKLPLSSTCRSSSQPSTTTTTRAAAPRTVPEKRPLMPKASSATTNQTIKTGTPNLASSQTASSTHITSSTVTVSSTATKRLLGTKTDSKPDTRKQLSSLKTTTGITTLSTLNS